MKLRVLAFAVICAGTLAAQRFLTNDDIVKMVESGVSQDIIIRMISESSVQFGLAPDNIIGFKKAGVPDDVVRAMLARSREMDQNRTPPPVPTTTPESNQVKNAAGTLRPALPEPMVRPEPGGLSNAQFEMGQGLRPVSKVEPVSHSADDETGYGWALRAGHPELRLSLGLNASPGRLNPVSLSGTGVVAIGINRYLAAFGSYSYNSTGSVDESVYSSGHYYTVSISGRIHEIVGGLRVSAPARLSPYAEVFGGAVRPNASASVLGVSAGLGWNEWVLGGGGGFNFAFNRHFGLNFDLSILKASELQWYGRATVGAYSRF